MIITLGGLPGSGTSTIAKILARKLKYRHIDAGDIWDQMAADRGLDVLGLNKLAEKDDSIDHELDERMLKRAREEDSLILEGRLIGWFTKREDISAFRVWITAPAEIRAVRVAQREGRDPEKIRRENDIREKSEAKRYQELYNIDISDLSAYDLIVDSAQDKPEPLVDFILEKLPKP